MFFIIDKRKINSYLISIGTVVMLLSASILMNNKSNIIETSAISNINTQIYKVQTKEKKVGLSINCNNNVDNIESILNSLDKTNIKVTFYITGELAQKYPKIIEQISQKGHDIGTLSYNYINLTNKTDEEIEKSILKGKNIIEGITKKDVSTLRTPYGKCNEKIIKQAQKNNLKIVQWNLDSLDYNGLDNEEICERISEGLTPGSIILVHNDGLNTAKSIADIIKTIQEKEYNIYTINDLIKL